MAEELSSPDHYVACTGDYDCAADEHIDGCGIVDKRAADEHGQDVNDIYDAAYEALLEYLHTHHRSIYDLTINFSDGDERRFRVLHDNRVLVINDGTNDVDWIGLG